MKTGWINDHGTLVKEYVASLRKASNCQNQQFGQIRWMLSVLQGGISAEVLGEELAETISPTDLGGLLFRVRNGLLR